MSKFFIRRPIVAIVIAILTVIVGIVAMLSLPTSQYPDIVPPEIMVQATYPGADAKTLAQAVATPIEQQMNGVDNMLYMSSVSANNGQATLYVDFDVKTNADTDQVLSQLRVAQAEAQLPAQVNAAGIVVQKSLSSPLMVVSLVSPDKRYDVNFLTNYAIINLQDELTRIPGVARIQVFGGQYALRVWVHPDQLAKLGVTATDVINAIQVQNNVNPAGKIGGEPAPMGQQFTNKPAAFLTEHDRSSFFLVASLSQLERTDNLLLGVDHGSRSHCLFARVERSYLFVEHFPGCWCTDREIPNHRGESERYLSRRHGNAKASCRSCGLARRPWHEA
jgi:multidrug efflux pump subunit AcrB